MTDQPERIDEAATRRVGKEWFAALDRGDFDAAIALLDPNIEWVNLPKVEGVSEIVPWLGTCHGVAEVMQSFVTRNEVVDVKVFEPVDLLIEGDQGFGTVHDYAVVKDTGVAFDIVFGTWFQVRDGKIVRWKSYCDAAPIVAAFRAGLPQRLLQAVLDDDLPRVQNLLAQGADPNVRDAETGLTALMSAACHAQPQIVKALLDAGADPLTTDSKTGATPLHKACQGGSVEVAKLLVGAGAFIDAVTPTMGHTPIMDALWYKWPELVEYLAEQGANLNLATHYGFTLMDHYNFELNVNEEGKEHMLRIGAVLERRKQSDQAEIERQRVMAATNAGDTAAVEALIKRGEDVNTLYPHVNSFSDGHTPLLVAARDNHTEIVDMLLLAGAKVRVEDWVFKGSPIHKATYNGRADILRLLMDQPDIDIDVVGPINGYTPLHDALWHGYTECARLLLDAGARLDLKGHDGKTPLAIATDVYGPDAEIVRQIQARMGQQKAAA